MSVRQSFQHFGHTETFKIYDVEEGKVVHSEVVDTNGSGHGALAGVLNALNADILICGGIGGGAQTALAAAVIKKNSKNNNIKGCAKVMEKLPQHILFA